MSLEVALYHTLGQLLEPPPPLGLIAAPVPGVSTLSVASPGAPIPQPTGVASIVRSSA